jgi:predicted CXXCH cytochrome family protein
VHSSWNAKLLTVPEDQLCQSCHEDVEQEQMFARHAHKPVRDGRCGACHDAHASDHVFQLRAEPDRLCASCHEHAPLFEHIDGAARRHGALDAETGCLTCHDGHASMMPALLVSSPLDLCLSCHDTSVLTSEGRTLTNMADLLSTNPDHHGPIRRADCSACHDPHASANPNLLEKHYPPMFYAPFDLKTYELCFSCHLTELATEQRGTEVTSFRDGDRNLHYLHVNKKERGRTCRTCHEVHASQRAFHIREEVPFGESDWMIEINFQSLPDGGQCAPGCHEPQTYTRVADPVPAAADPKGDSP